MAEVLLCILAFSQEGAGLCDNYGSPVFKWFLPVAKIGSWQNTKDCFLPGEAAELRVTFLKF